MTRYLVTALLAVACSTPVPPAVGDASYQTALICVPADLAETFSDSVELWHEAAPRVTMRVAISDSPECDVLVTWGRLDPPRINAGTVDGSIVLDVSLRGGKPLVEATHEIGHLLLGHGHSADPASVMFATSNVTTITEDDLKRLPERK
jgi:hypothetical protein